MIKLHNSLTKTVDPLKPISKAEIRVYSCGPTVYDDVHIGNLAYFIVVDTLNRALRAAGYKVHHVMNITDIDDKIIKRSQREYPDNEPKEALHKIARKYETGFKEDSKSVGNDLELLDFINATDSIHIIQELIRKLHEVGIAYVADDGVYFSIDEYRKNGHKYGQLIDIEASNTSQSRINNDEYDKDSIFDFALWKNQKPNEPAWEFKLGGENILGRPGWHIECSAMSSSKLGQPFDIHTGGIDLLFPHHENEIAQSTGSNKELLYATFFVHNEHVTVEARKMSKSLGNIITLKDIIDHKHDPYAFRLLILQSNYRNQAEFNWDLMKAAESRLRGLRNLAALKWQVSDNADYLDVDFDEEIEKINTALFDNLNTPRVLAHISEMQNKLEGKLLGSKLLEQFNKYISHLDLILGLQLSEVDDITDEQKDLLKKRDKSRQQKNWTESDNLRQELAQIGIGINDSSKGQVWFRL